MNKPYRRIIVLSAAMAALSISQVRAQDERDALRFSFLQPQGTARSIGIGSALGSVGGDFSSLSVNPAGIGIYRRGEIMITPSLTFTNSESDFSGNSLDEGGSHFAFSNVGIVTTKVESARRRQRTGWSTVSFGFGLTRLADFTRNYSYEGRNTSSSGSFVFENDANVGGVTTNSDEVTTPGDLGYYSYLLDTVAGGGFLSVVNPTPGAPISQSNIVSERGGISEVGLTFGGSYQDKFLIGGTLGIPIVRYSRSRTYEERDLSGNNSNDFDNFRYTDDLKINGAGINLKLGFIYRPVDNFRFGAAIHTPTYFGLTDVQNRSLTANTEDYARALNGNSVNTAVALENQYEYNLTTPWRGIASATALFGSFGFFTVDYEFVDYSSSRFRFGASADEKDYQRIINNTIKQTFKPASNIRTGLEIRLDNFMVRGGFGYYGNPYRRGRADGERLEFSTGLGFRFENAFLDLGFVHRRYKSSEQPYTLPDTDVPNTLYYGLVVPTAQLQTAANTLALTVGFKL